ncbi:MAG TPA: leucyl aminopeptidase, partial [Alphaproteobacteria bacterium]|nr:leucyl aminopeptidase [Alphaproteobacteria bacterium]
MDITFAKLSHPSVGGLITLAAENAGLTVTAVQLDRKMRGALKRAMEAEKFTGKNGQLLVILAPAGLRADRVILVGVGKG